MCKFCEARKEGTVCEIESNKLLQQHAKLEAERKMILKRYLSILQDLPHSILAILELK